MPSSSKPRSSIWSRSSWCTNGTVLALAETMTTRSCRTWFRSTLARSASGTVSFVGCGNTAVPGTRVIGCSWSSLTNSCSDPSSCCLFAVTILRPACHVVMTVNTAAATSSGSHPAVPDLDEVARQVDQLHAAEDDAGQDQLPGLPVPQVL